LLPSRPERTMLDACHICGELGHDPASCRQVTVDYDEAGRQLIERLHLEGRNASAGAARANTCTRTRECRCPRCDDSYGLLGEAVLPLDKHGPLNLLWRSPHGNGSVFVGGIAAAKDRSLLQRCGITHVVQCMNRPSLNVHPGINYLDFSIAKWRDAMPIDSRHRIGNNYTRSVGPTGEVRWVERLCRTDTVEDQELASAVGDLFAPVVSFIRHAVDAGGGVLIHCFAGAHRAGTTGVAWLMHADGLDAADATAAAQRQRPCIDPKAHGDLHELLLYLEAALSPSPSCAASTSPQSRAGEK